MRCKRAKKAKGSWLYWANTNLKRDAGKTEEAFVTGFNYECLAGFHMNPQCGASAHCFVLESPRLFGLQRFEIRECIIAFHGRARA